jgi:hypothetical protein
LAVSNIGQKFNIEEDVVSKIKNRPENTPSQTVPQNSSKRPWPVSVFAIFLVIILVIGLVIIIAYFRKK